MHEAVSAQLLAHLKEAYGALDISIVSNLTVPR